LNTLVPALSKIFMSLMPVLHCSFGCCEVRDLFVPGNCNDSLVMTVFAVDLLTGVPNYHPKTCTADLLTGCHDWRCWICCW
jgi:hypothetical protein